MKKGLTLIELLIALFLAGLVVGFAVSILRDENSNMIHIRSRVQSQTAARDGLKILESELRAAGFGVTMAFPNTATRPLEMGSVKPACIEAIDVLRQSSIVAMDGNSGGNDTLDLAFPTKVDATTGATCFSTRWTRYVVVNGELMRYEGATRSSLNSKPNATMVGKNVDVFQLQLSASGISKSGKVLLAAADSCCPGGANWTKTAVTVTPHAAARTDELDVAGVWSYLSKEKDLSIGETWRLRFIIQDADAPLLKDLKDNAPASFVKIGLYSKSGKNDVILPILTRPTDASTAFGQLVEADLVVPASEKYQIGLSGYSTGKLTIEGFNALSVRLGSDSTWLKNPSNMNTDDWSRVKSVRVQVLTRAPADKRDYYSKFTGLANYQQTSSAPVGEFNATDSSIRVLLDHHYPAGNNGKF